MAERLTDVLKAVTDRDEPLRVTVVAQKKQPQAVAPPPRRAPVEVRGRGDVVHANEAVTRDYRTIPGALNPMTGELMVGNSPENSLLTPAAAELGTVAVEHVIPPSGPDRLK